MAVYEKTEALYHFFHSGKYFLKEITQYFKTESM